MAAGEVRLEGLASLRRTLRAAGDDLSDMKAAHKDAALVAAAQVRAEAPVGEDTPHLLNTIRAAGTKTAAIIRAGNNSNVRYAGPINYGWGRRHIAANPFMQRGARKSESRWLPVYMRYIERSLDQVKGI